jgi:serine phosphatase RsbU (regulator of sigma subunit)
MIRGLVEENVDVAHDPGELLTRVNHALAGVLRQADTTMFATCFYAVADLECAELRFANAGHPCALHVKNGHPPVAPLRGENGSNLALGILASARYPTSRQALAAGDLIMLFTDGLFEVEDATGNFFSQELLQEAVARHVTFPPQEFFTRVLNDIRSFSRRETFDDDVCVVGMQVEHLNGTRAS